MCGHVVVSPPQERLERELEEREQEEAKMLLEQSKGKGKKGMKDGEKLDKQVREGVVVRAPGLPAGCCLSHRSSQSTNTVLPVATVQHVRQHASTYCSLALLTPSSHTSASSTPTPTPTLGIPSPLPPPAPLPSPRCPHLSTPTPHCTPHSTPLPPPPGRVRQRAA